MTRRILILTAVFLITYLFLEHTSDSLSVPPKRPLDQFPSTIDGFVQIAEDRLDDNIIAILGVDQHILRTYQDQEGTRVTLYIGYFEDQKEGQMIHSPKHCLPGSGWFPLDSRQVALSLEGQGEIQINRLLLEKSGQKMLVYYWYQGRGRIVANEYEDRLYLLWDKLWSRRSDESLVRISLLYKDQASEEAARRFIKALLPVLDGYFPS
ncbi:EpsI family protein [Thermosulfuriphilus ammonigenes]|uniref:EpsI family protein n=1 Tax=Thermosulfuriphilus ammonigenes TaxID=1936021 RepID=A0A6G7PUR1_9BACT|nr:exosortase C-terminal domain/associated protein EpsI [Thermosulfuriphilus ammonigenes]MBA2848562.1 EpsI family protein [Thermosulfuriphilus ammonigenes]QIJ71296.1 EpsI family protein [Thermosulfuriphilus ammonigenes]HFB84146.1 EpsI family protein [Thermodesulfatator sp.]